MRQIQSDRHPGGFGCSIMDSSFVKELRRGLRSTLVYKCRMCNKETTLDTDHSDDKSLSINTAVVAGAVNGGGGFANLDEIAAAIDMPCMSAPTYILHERKFGRKVQEALLKKMQEAGEEERRLAIEAGDVCEDGTPWIRVVADGMWCKRCYKNKYDALSGCASIVGYRTGKVLFYAVRNKFCQICTLARKRRRTPKRHQCFKDFEGASTKMETEIILEGFQASEKMHKVRYLDQLAPSSFPAMPPHHIPVCETSISQFESGSNIVPDKIKGTLSIPYHYLSIFRN
ncbi:uncharacterized protein LOC113210376 [Frankliniella occidentalis]|uniref:Uncharacterized protein LOC113210376 n=1 Tax=Frankliniella occidentalis TaxID=133901 RepID=A0A9C6X8Y8_FRAOC|nr:uncharacterized protein LOC113210376 [Frankliniella occidentalis]